MTGHLASTPRRKVRAAGTPVGANALGDRHGLRGRDGLGRSRKRDQLSIAEETVKSLMKSIMLKLSGRDRTHAVMIALKRGVLSQ